jgi:hypothetical protein
MDAAILTKLKDADVERMVHVILTPQSPRAPQQLTGHREAPSATRPVIHILLTLPHLR